MKKLMFSAAAATLAGVALADMPAVYDYKASVKHMYLKEVNVSIQVNAFGTRQSFKVYQKYQKSSSLKGYLIHDVLGATSWAANKAGTLGAVGAALGTASQEATDNAARVSDVQVLAAGPVLRGNNVGPMNVPATGLRIADKVNNRAFLIVQNANAEAQVRRPKILPAVLEAKFFDQKYQIQWNGLVGQPKYTAGVAEGTLFVGGDLGRGVKEWLRRNRDDVAAINASVAQDSVGGVNLLALGSYLDYGWTSIYLWGKYNGAQGSGFWNLYQAAVSGIQIIPDVGGARFFHDTWMNGAGIGKFAVVDDSEACCGFQVGGVNFGLDTLSGNLKGGLFLCSENGYTVTGYNKLVGIDWEDQFWNEKAFRTYADNGVDPNAYSSTNVAKTDTDQEDVWIDGDVEQFTTDVLYGTWSIKRLATAKVPTEELTDAEIGAITGLNLGNGNRYVTTLSCVAGNVDDTNLADLNATIKGCAQALNANVEFVRGNAATAIPNIATAASNARFTVPFLSRQFAQAYGLAGYSVRND